jgi:hypothetical protein
MADIDVDKLTDPQYHGLACVVDERHVFEPEAQRYRVGFLGDDMHPVYACPGNCVRAVSRLVMQRPKHALVTR